MYCTWKICKGMWKGPQHFIGKSIMAFYIYRFKIPLTLRNRNTGFILIIMVYYQVWSLSSFKVSLQLLTNDLNQASSVSLLMTTYPPTKGRLEVCVFIFSFKFLDAALVTKTMCTQSLIPYLLYGDAPLLGNVCSWLPRQSLPTKGFLNWLSALCWHGPSRCHLRNLLSSALISDLS